MIMGNEVFDVFKQKRDWSFGIEDRGDIEEKSALSSVSEAMGFAHAVFFGDTGYTERLAGKAGQKNIEIGKIRRSDFRDVSEDFVIILKICPVYFLSVGIPFGSADTFSAASFKTHPNSADSGKKVCKAEILRHNQVLRAVVARIS